MAAAPSLVQLAQCAVCKEPCQLPAFLQHVVSCVCSHVQDRPAKRQRDPTEEDSEPKLTRVGEAEAPTPLAGDDGEDLALTEAERQFLAEALEVPSAGMSWPDSPLLSAYCTILLTKLHRASMAPWKRLTGENLEGVAFVEHRRALPAPEVGPSGPQSWAARVMRPPLSSSSQPGVLLDVSIGHVASPFRMVLHASSSTSLRRVGEKILREWLPGRQTMNLLWGEGMPSPPAGHRFVENAIACVHAARLELPGAMMMRDAALRETLALHMLLSTPPPSSPPHQVVSSATPLGTVLGRCCGPSPPLVAFLPQPLSPMTVVVSPLLSGIPPPSSCSVAGRITVQPTCDDCRSSLAELVPKNELSEELLAFSGHLCAVCAMARVAKSAAMLVQEYQERLVDGDPEIDFDEVASIDSDEFEEVSDWFGSVGAALLERALSVRAKWLKKRSKSGKPTVCEGGIPEWARHLKPGSLFRRLGLSPFADAGGRFPDSFLIPDSE
jgi:hypothetical protein